MGIRKRIHDHYHWIVAVIAFLMIAMVLGLANNLFSLYVIPVTKDLGISRGAFSMMSCIKNLAAFGANLLLGVIYSRFGFHRPAFAAMLLLGAAYVGFSFARGVGLFYAGAVFCGLCEPFCGTAAASRLVSDWFNRHRGAVLGVVLAASGLGASALSVLLSNVITRSGWRGAYLLSAILVAAVAVILMLFVRDTPQKMGLHPAGFGAPAPRARRERRTQDWEGYSMKELAKKPSFYLILAAIVLIGVATLGSYPILAAHLQDQGLSAAFSASMLGLMFLMLSVAKILIGAALDRFGAGPVALFCALCNVAGLLFLAKANTPFLALCYVLLYPFALTVQTVLLPSVATECFGRHAYNGTLSLMLALIALSGAFAAPLLNFGYDRLGSYSPLLLGLAATGVLAAALLLAGFRGAARSRAAFEAAAEKKKECL